MQSTAKRLLVLAVFGTFLTTAGQAQVAELQDFIIIPVRIGGGSIETATGTVTIRRFSCPECEIQVPITVDNPGALWGVPSPGPIVPSGQTFVSFTFGGNILSQDTLVTLTATLGISISREITVVAPVPRTTITPNTIVGGSIQRATGTITLDPPPRDAANVRISPNPPGIVRGGDGFVQIPGGQRTGTFTLSAPVRAQSVVVTISATYGTTQTATITVLSPDLTLDVLPQTLLGGSPDTATAVISIGLPTPPDELANIRISWSPELPLIGLPSGVVQIPAGQTSIAYEFRGDRVAQDTTGTITIEYLFGGPTVTSPFTVLRAVCTIPTGELTESAGWADDAGLPTIHRWRQTLTPITTSFAGRSVKERDAGGGGPDTCWFPDSNIPPQTLLTGGGTIVAADNTWCCDEVGWDPPSVTYYRQQGRAPCGTTLRQWMVIDCFPGQVIYVTNTLTAGIGTTTVSSGRAGQSVSRTWP